MFFSLWLKIFYYIVAFISNYRTWKQPPFRGEKNLFKHLSTEVLAHVACYTFVSYFVHHLSMLSRLLTFKLRQLTIFICWKRKHPLEVNKPHSIVRFAVILDRSGGASCETELHSTITFDVKNSEKNAFKYSRLLHGYYQRIKGRNFKNLHRMSHAQWKKNNETGNISFLHSTVWHGSSNIICGPHFLTNIIRILEEYLTKYCVTYIYTTHIS